MEVRAASFPADLEIVRKLFREYAGNLGIDLAFQQFEEELAGLPGPYVPPVGGIWLATEGELFGGCVGLRPFTSEDGEMKRLYVRQEFRRRGVGRLLAQRAVDAASEYGYRRVCLDTLSSMTAATGLYRSLGFVEVPRYRQNPVPGAISSRRNWMFLIEFRLSPIHTRDAPPCPEHSHSSSPPLP
jgi:ribosomal protein S18 acetylase RimI-like enzyme